MPGSCSSKTSIIPDDAVEVLLKAGDCVIQNGTRHAWHNRSSEKCVIADTLVAAERKH
jgi:hypothetical protein